MARVLHSSRCSELWLPGMRTASPLLTHVEKKIFFLPGGFLRNPVAPQILWEANPTQITKSTDAQSLA